MSNMLSQMNIIKAPEEVKKKRKKRNEFLNVSYYLQVFIIWVSTAPNITSVKSEQR